jgi:hypothetical protein
MSDRNIRFIFSGLVLLVVVLKSYIPGYWLMPIAALPMLFSNYIYQRKEWGNHHRIKSLASLFMLTSALGYALIIIEPNFYGVYFGILAFLISKLIFLKILRSILGFFVVSKWQNTVQIILISTVFLIFFHYFFLDQVESIYLYPIFIYILVDTITLYTLIPVLEGKSSYKWLGFWAILTFTFSDFFFAFYTFTHWINDDYTSTLVIGYLGYFLCIDYFYKVFNR